MLPAVHRMRRAPDFAAAVRRGRRSGRACLTVHLLSARAGATGPEAPALVGFVVSRAVGGSVVRHRVQRRLRHLVSERIGQLPPGSLLVVRALPPSAAAASPALAADLDSALRSATGPARTPGRGGRS